MHDAATWPATWPAKATELKRKLPVFDSDRKIKHVLYIERLIWLTCVGRAHPLDRKGTKVICNVNRNLTHIWALQGSRKTGDQLRSRWRVLFTQGDASAEPGGRKRSADEALVGSDDTQPVAAVAEVVDSLALDLADVSSQPVDEHGLATDIAVHAPLRLSRKDAQFKLEI
jgi:hypothetical protein